MISAVGLIDPSDARYQTDKALLQSDLRADSRSQLVEKALALFVDKASLAKNYDCAEGQAPAEQRQASSRPSSRKASRRSARTASCTLTTEAVVDVKAVQKSLNQMSRDERIEFIRASGDPKVSRADRIPRRRPAGAPPQPSPAAENILKERIKSFGFRTWSEGGARADDGTKGPDFSIEGEVKIKRLSTRLPASGLVVTKYGLNAWTIKAIDRETGEEIYYNTTLPTGMGSWASEEEALTAIGTRIANEFSRDFFLQHVTARADGTGSKMDGLPATVTRRSRSPQLAALSSVINVARPAAARVRSSARGQRTGPGPRRRPGILKPLNAKLGQACFAVGASASNEVGVTFDAKCNDPAVLGKLETNPPAALYNAPQSHRARSSRIPTR